MDPEGSNHSDEEIPGCEWSIQDDCIKKGSDGTHLSVSLTVKGQRSQDC